MRRSHVRNRSLRGPGLDRFPASRLPMKLNPHQQLAFDIYKELVEINTVTATGDTARAAEAMAARLRAAGFADADVHAFSPAPHKGDLVARLHGSGARKPILLVAHLDVVPADPRGLVGRSVQADREGRLFLCARQRRRQIHGGVLYRQPDPLQAGRLQARSRHHRGAGDRRGDSGSRRARHPVADQKPPRPDRCRIRLERGRRRRIEGRQADPEQRPDQRKVLGQLSVRGQKQGRPQRGPDEGQCDLSAGGRIGAAVEIRFSAQPQ